MIRTSDGSIGSPTVTFAQEKISDLTTGVRTQLEFQLYDSTVE